MGGVVSSGETNDQLVTNLCKERYIVTPEVERVFRMIDRQNYMTFDEEDDNPLEAYEDHAWRKGNLHLSAPCIYTKAMEYLQLGPGQSFLNIGSGTGYFSTMVGLILGPNGINHGIELFEDNVEFAMEKLKQFKEESPWYDPVEFCEPYFVSGNALLLSPSGLLYDRIYCGAACPVEHMQLMKNMLRNDGILIMPCENCLLSITRNDSHNWTTDTILSTVSFAPLILPSASKQEDLTAITIKSTVLSLKEQCRVVILRSLKRHRYSSISLLPLPSYLQQFVSLGRQWNIPLNEPELMTPLPEEEEEEEGEGEGEGEEEGNRTGPIAAASIRNIGGNRQAIIVNINGMLIQLPIGDDDYDMSSNNDSEEEGDELG